MTQEQLAQIEARAATAHGFLDEEYEHRSYAYSGDDPYVAVARQARDAARALDEVDIPALIAHIRKLEAERLTAEERELMGRACWYMRDALISKRTGAADRDAQAIMAVRAKIESMEGDEG